MVTKADLDGAGWRESIGACEKMEVGRFTAALITKALVEQKAGNESGYMGCRFLAQLCSMRLLDDDSGVVFGPTVVLAEGRSLVVEDLSVDDLKVLEEFLPEVAEAELAARIGDILWVAGRKHASARIAVDAYLSAARKLEDPDHWLATSERLKRAVHLAASLGKGGLAEFERAIGSAQEVLDRYQGSDPSFLSAELMELLQDYRRGDPGRYASYAETAALRAEAEPNFFKARAYWKAKARWHQIANDSDQEIASRLRYAQTFVTEADREVSRAKPSFLRAATYLRHGIEEFRRIPSGKAHADRLRERLDEYQGRGMAELRPIEAKFDPSPMIEKAQRAVEGKPFLDALLSLAMLGSSPSRHRLTKDAKKIVPRTPFQHLSPLLVVDQRGRPIRHRPSIDPSNLDASEEGMLGEVLRNAETLRMIHVVGTIEPARRQIFREHPFKETDLFPILFSSPFVPSGREGIFGRGLAAGLRGDFLVAAHLLVPQLENSIREILRDEGAQTVSLDAEGIQQDKTLTQLLYLEEMTETFGEDLTFDLQGLLVDEFGANLRNRLAHGLLTQSDFYGTPVSYMWWLTLRLCCLPLIKSSAGQQSETASPPES